MLQEATLRRGTGTAMAVATEELARAARSRLETVVQTTSKVTSWLLLDTRELRTLSWYWAGSMPTSSLALLEAV